MPELQKAIEAFLENRKGGLARPTRLEFRPSLWNQDKEDWELKTGTLFPGRSFLEGAEDFHLVGKKPTGDELDRRGQGEVGERGPSDWGRKVGGGHDHIVGTGLAVESYARVCAVGEGCLQQRLGSNQHHPAWKNKN